MSLFAVKILFLLDAQKRKCLNGFKQCYFNFKILVYSSFHSDLKCLFQVRLAVWLPICTVGLGLYLWILVSHFIHENNAV